MSRRTIGAYESAFKYIHINLIPLRGKAIIIDFERAMRRALLKIIKSINSNLCVLGCWFHLCQALRRKLAQMPMLFAKVKSNECYANIFRRFQCLALLPENFIEISFIDLAKESLKLDKTLFAPFIDYFNNEWIKNVTPKHFCVHMHDKRTTGDAEAFNGFSNKVFRTHGSFYIFCETLQKIEAFTSNQLANFINGTQQKDNRSSFYKKRSAFMKKFQWNTKTIQNYY